MNKPREGSCERAPFCCQQKENGIKEFANPQNIGSVNWIPT